MPETNLSQLYLGLLPKEIFVLVVRRLPLLDQKGLAKDDVFRQHVENIIDCIGWRKMAAYFPSELRDAEALSLDYLQNFPTPNLPPVDLNQLAKENFAMMSEITKSTHTSIIEPDREIPLKKLTPRELYICGMLAYKAPHRLTDLQHLRCQSVPPENNITEKHIFQSQYFFPVAFRDPDFVPNSEVTDDLLHCCIATGNDEILKKFLNTRVNNLLTNKVEMFRTLTIAVRYGHYEVLSHVLQHYPEYASYILSVAFYYGRYTIANRALDTPGLDINNRTDVHLYGNKVLQFNPTLILLEHNKIPPPLKTRFRMNMLLKIISKISLLNPHNIKLKQSLIKLPSACSQLFLDKRKDLSEFTLNKLSIAAKYHNLSIVRFLLGKYDLTKKKHKHILTTAMNEFLKGFATNPDRREDAFEIFKLFISMKSNIGSITKISYITFIELSRFQEIADSLLKLSVVCDLDSEANSALLKTLALGHFRQVLYLIDMGAIPRNIYKPNWSATNAICAILSHKNSDIKEQELLTLLQALGIEQVNISPYFNKSIKKTAEDCGNVHLYSMLVKWMNSTKPCLNPSQSPIQDSQPEPHLSMSQAGSRPLNIFSAVPTLSLRLPGSMRSTLSAAASAAALTEAPTMQLGASQRPVSPEASSVNPHNKRYLDEPSQAYPQSKRQNYIDDPLDLPKPDPICFDYYIPSDYSTPPATPKLQDNAAMRPLPGCYSSSSGGTYKAYTHDDKTMLIPEDDDGGSSLVTSTMAQAYLDEALPCDEDLSESALLQPGDTSLSILSFFRPAQDSQKNILDDDCTHEDDEYELDNPYDDDDDYQAEIN